MISLATRQEEMRRRYLPALERQEEKKRRGRPLKRSQVEALLFPPRKKKHFSEQCQIGWHYLDCPDLNCECTCHNDEYKGEQAQ